MAGRNHHHIPQLLQRGFALDGSDGLKIWRIEKGRKIKKPKSISTNAAELDFYTPDVDKAITDDENYIANLLHALWELPEGTSVDPPQAAEIVHHFSPRTAHLRLSLERGLRQIIAGAAEIFSSQESLGALIGLDQDEPNALFNDQIDEIVRSVPQLEWLGLPAQVLTRLLFVMGKEQFDETAAQVLPLLENVTDYWREHSEEISRTGHNKSLAKRAERTPRFNLLANLTWHIEAAPAEGAILPDCVALGLAKDGAATPFMLMGSDELHGVVMPLSTHKLLVGLPESASLPQDFDYNGAAARSSQSYFLSASDANGIAELQAHIDECSSPIIDAATSEVLQSYRPPADVLRNSNEADRDSALVPSQPFQYELTIPSSDDPEKAARIAPVVQAVVAGLSQSLPLSRLQSITFSWDYAIALSGVERGIEGLQPPRTIDPSVARGIAQSVLVHRDGMIKCEIIADAQIAFALIDDDEATVSWAMAVLTRQLTLVSLTAMFDDRLPGILMKPITDPLQVLLHPAIDGAHDAYMASRLSTGFGDASSMIDSYRELAIDCLATMTQSIPKQRLEYRHHGDLDLLLERSLASIGQFLSFAANLLGTCAAAGVVPFEPESEFETALKQAGLLAWLPRFEADLEKLWLRLGAWESFDEFIALDVHVERLLWKFGIYPWLDGDRALVAVPLLSDAEALGLAELVS